MKSLIPFCCSKSIFNIDINFFIDAGCHFILSDLDNTLCSYRDEYPSEKVIEFVKNLANHGIKLIIVSNNSENRVKRFCEKIDCEYIFRAKKPFTGKIRHFLQLKKIKYEECFFIGDQLLTDIKCANKLNIRSVFTQDLVKENQLTTKINKFFAKFPLYRLKSKNLLINWEVLYGRAH